MTINPFDLKSALLAKHAQHVVLVHFPIALFISSFVFDLLAIATGIRSLAKAAYYNLIGAAITALAAVATGVLAWQLQLEGERLRGNLRLHLGLGASAAVLIWLLTWWRRRQEHSDSRSLAVGYVRLIIMPLDHDHGFKIDAYHIDELLKKGEQRTIEFTANESGTFPFQCSHFCGLGHKGMNGELIVERVSQESPEEQPDASAQFRNR